MREHEPSCRPPPLLPRSRRAGRGPTTKLRLFRRMIQRVLQHHHERSLLLLRGGDDDDRCRTTLRRSHSLRSSRRWSRPVVELLSSPIVFAVGSVVGCLLLLGLYYCRLWMSLYRSFDAAAAHDAGDVVGVGGLGLGHYFALSDGRRRGGDPSLAFGSHRVSNGTKTDDDDGAAVGDGRGDVRASSPDPSSSTHHHHRTHGNSSPPLERHLGNTSIAERVREILIARTGYPNLLLGAYLEPPLPLLPVVETSDRGESRMKMRVHAPQNLTYVSYPPPPHRKNIAKHGDDVMNDQPAGACSNGGAQWIFPTSHPKSLDHRFGGNVFKRRPNFDMRWELATGGVLGNDVDDASDGYGRGGHCPVDADPYLPWIHDAFPSADGRHVEFVISNKRRCNTDPGKFAPDLRNLEPQVALMQPVPVKRITIRGGGGSSRSSTMP